MKKSFDIVHVIAECQDCRWRTESHKNGQAIAAKHAKAHRHKVNVEVGLAGYYDNRINTKHQNNLFDDL